MHPFEIGFFRNLFGLLVVLPWFIRFGWRPLRTQRLRLHGLRAAINAASMLAFFFALSIAPLTQVTALGFTAPIIATLLAIFLFRERVGVRRWCGIIIGFLGTVVVLRPGFDAIGLGAVLTIMAAIGWAFVLLVIKSLGRTESSVTITTYMSLLMAPIALVPALFVWQWPNPSQWLWLVLVGTSGNAGQLLMVWALKQAETNVVMPFDFFKLVWVSMIAYFAFAEVPDLFTWLGGTMIFSGAAYIAYRERRLGSPTGT
jgi:drug/metabolite transporter (DMT)-like permease